MRRTAPKLNTEALSLRSGKEGEYPQASRAGAGQLQAAPAAHTSCMRTHTVRRASGWRQAGVTGQGRAPLQVCRAQSQALTLLLVSQRER
jgi:hypothetical protein